MKILLAVDGSRNSLHALDCILQHADWYREKPAIELLTVRVPVPKLHNLSKVVSKAQIQSYYREEGEARLTVARKALDRAGIAYEARILVGPVAETIVKHAEETLCDLICIGTRGMTELSQALVGSVATKVMHITSLPVLLVRWPAVARGPKPVGLSLNSGTWLQSVRHTLRIEATGGTLK
jgi:nucleotide-binding universal stress UspA family protein